MSPTFALLSVAQVVRSIATSTQDTMLAWDLKILIEDRDRSLVDTDYLANGGRTATGALQQLSAIFNTPFGYGAVKGIRGTITTRYGRDTAVIKGAYFDRAEARAGEAVTLSVVVEPFAAPEQVVKVPLTIPSAPGKMRELTVAVMAGAEAPIDGAMPDSLTTYLDAIEKQHRATDLVMVTRQPTEGMQIRGRLFKNLPPSARSVLESQQINNVTPIADLEHTVIPTRWVLSGRGAATITIQRE